MATREHIPIANDSLAEAASEAFDCVEGEVFEVLEGVGLAHVRTASGHVLGLNRNTIGIEFSKLRKGVRVRCKFTLKFHRVLHAELIA